MGVSSGVSRRKCSASSRIFSSRLGVSEILRETAAVSASNVMSWKWRAPEMGSIIVRLVRAQLTTLPERG